MTINNTIPPRDHWPTEGWRSSDPGAQGMDAARLAAADAYLNARAPHLDSLLIVRHGCLVWERYSRQAAIDRLHNVKSAAKSVLSLLVGIALQTGDLMSLDDTLGDFLAAYFTGAVDRRKRDIRLRDLLTMRSGLEWREWGGTTQQMTASPDWVRFVLDRPLSADPGTRYNYSTGDTQLIAAVLQQATGMTALAFADLYLFAPLGIERRTWPTDPQGITIGGAELALSSRDLAKLGYLVLNRGQWGGETIVPAAWIAESTQAHANVIPAGTDDCVQLDYGYLWWLRQQGDYASWLAVGYGGQVIYVIPALDLVVVITGDLRDVPDGFRDNRMLCAFNVVQDAILPAVLT
ncbi:MAG: serine hydrolase [Anaerolineae bacterium]|nr:serine hydrolase [Anaerolineae bacterium]